MVAVRVVIANYGAGNLRSVARAVSYVGGDPIISAKPRDIADADAVIMPGVGSAADTMLNLNQHGLVGPLLDFMTRGGSFLGVCMGQQILFEMSEEGGEHPCLGVLRGRVSCLPTGLKVPHIGWNRVRSLRAHPIFEGIKDGSFFYFVHSYYPQPDDPSVVVAVADYGLTFPAVIARGSVVATQFHPEKSGEIGLRLYKNFLRIAASNARD